MPNSQPGRINTILRFIGNYNAVQAVPFETTYDNLAKLRNVGRVTAQKIAELTPVWSQEHWDKHGEPEEVVVAALRRGADVTKYAGYLDICTSIARAGQMRGPTEDMANRLRISLAEMQRLAAKSLAVVMAERSHA